MCVCSGHTLYIFRVVFSAVRFPAVCFLFFFLFLILKVTVKRTLFGVVSSLWSFHRDCGPVPHIHDRLRGAELLALAREACFRPVKGRGVLFEQCFGRTLQNQSGGVCGLDAGKPDRMESLLLRQSRFSNSDQSPSVCLHVDKASTRPSRCSDRRTTASNKVTKQCRDVYCIKFPLLWTYILFEPCERMEMKSCFHHQSY